MADVAGVRQRRSRKFSFMCGTNCLALVILTLLVGRNSAFTVHLTDQCGKTINIKSRGGQVSSQAAATYAADTDCELTLQADSGKNIYLRLERLDIPDGSNGQNCGDSLWIYDGPSATGSYLGGPICGSSAGGEYESTGDAVTLKFTSDSDSQRGSGFFIVYAAFDNGSPCDSDEFECGNGHCISENLKCDLADHCGDNTDESSSALHANCANGAASDSVTVAQSRGLGVGVIAAIAIAVILFVILIALAVCFFILQKQDNSASQQTDSETQEPALQTVAYTSNPAAAKTTRVEEENLAITELSEPSPSHQPPPAQQPRPEEPALQTVAYTSNPAAAKTARMEEENLAIAELSEPSPSHQPPPAQQPRPEEPQLYPDQEPADEAAKPVYPDAVPGPPKYIPPPVAPASPVRDMTPVEHA